MHGGFKKECQYLARYYNLDPNAKDYFIESNYEIFLEISQQLLSGYFDEDFVLSKYSESQLFSFFGPNLSLQKYLNYYLSLDKYCEDRYSAVGDFSNNNWELNKNKMREINCLLKDYFDIKVICIFRDPIRRLWSQKCSFSLSNTNSIFVKKSKNRDGKVIRPSLTSEPVVNVVRNVPALNYAEKVSIAYDVFGKENVCYLIMEDFFKNQDNNSEVIKLEKFLNIEISPDKIYPCNYVTDLGINPPRLGNLEDQWNSDHEKLSPEIYQKLRNRKDYIQCYSDFENFHGSLPADWGYPIDYRY